VYRLWYEIKRKFGLLEKEFAVNTLDQEYITLDQWRKLDLPFFFNRKSDLTFEQMVSDDLKLRVSNIKKGIIRFFSSQNMDLGLDYDWITNPDTGFKYDSDIHWSKIETLSDAGDIKYVWEKSRFCYLYDLIKYDKATDESQAEFVLNEIDTWIAANSENKGPNYVCSQETSIRLLNWTFALMYFRDAPELNEKRFLSYSNAIYKQIKHVEQNIDFSRICVRNNHAITECFLLYFTGVMFPFYPESNKWKKQGIKFLEEEVDFQFFNDGGYLQYSHNYHRVALQVITWALIIGKKDGTEWSNKFHSKVGSSLTQLNSMMDEKSGCLPNYGNNDGALFFQLSDAEFRDYRPQLNALAVALYGGRFYKNKSSNTDIEWYTNKSDVKLAPKTHLYSFSDAGLYILEDEDLKVIVKCTDHKHRPAQADNLHIDVWYKGENMLIDGGSYKYNTSEEEVDYFMGTSSHNTIKLGSFNQMKKASRFIWNYWTTSLDVRVNETETQIVFYGSIKCYEELTNNIVHIRKVTLHKGKNEILIEDQIVNKPSNLSLSQLWHSKAGDKIELTTGNQVLKQKGWHSPVYGSKEQLDTYVCVTENESIETIINFK
jgi:hypothetical protein